jgi:hypothetical protein
MVISIRCGVAPLPELAADAGTDTAASIVATRM